MKNKSLKIVRENSQGYTLVELLIVLSIIVVVSGMGFGALIKSQTQQMFSNRFEKILSLINNARSLAITGKGQLDYTDFDHDKCNDAGAMTDGTCGTNPDYVTPANYGVNFDANTAGANKVTLFGDINPPTGGTATGFKGSYEKGISAAEYQLGKDLDLDSLVLDKNLCLFLEDKDGSTTKLGSILFNPNYADISFDKFAVDGFLKIRMRDKNEVGRCKEIKIHKLAGIPEVGQCIADPSEVCS